MPSPPPTSPSPTSSSLTYTSPSLLPQSPSSPPDLRLLHFNDVYHIEPGSADPVGGCARFQTLHNFYSDDTRFAEQVGLVTLFSGDALNPSLESAVTKGAHMVPVLNGLLGREEGRGVACVGNHDLDFGVMQFRLDTINSLPPNLIYKSASETAKALIPSLREQGADIIIALTHAREPSDVKLAENTPPGLIDLILGGHDHFYAHQIVNGVHILRSGTDFKQLSYIEAYRHPSSSSSSSTSSPQWAYRITRRDITRSIPEDPPTLHLVSTLTSTLKSKLEKPIGYTFAPLDARFTTVRTRESNLGNFVCDLMRHTYTTDCALMAGGTIRGDQVYPPGLLRLKDIMNCFPFEDPVIVIRVRGLAIRAALENSVALVPALEGRFSQVSGIRFGYAPTLPAGARVKWVEVAGAPLDDERAYTMATRGYMGRGKDGFTSLLVRSEGGAAEEVVSEENGVLISMILRQYFMSLKVLRRWRRWGPGLRRHWGGVQVKLGNGGGELDVDTPHTHTSTRSAHPPIHTPDTKTPDPDTDDDDDDADNLIDNTTTHPDSVRANKDRESHLARSVTRHWMRVAGIRSAGVVADEGGLVVPVPEWTKGVRPGVEGRIVVCGC
ncbi:MAG: hypothetical protein Q9182_006023 [Xanthomendoza sp. 2 TL-2023]